MSFLDGVIRFGTSEATVEKEDNYPKGRMLRHMCRVFDPDNEYACSYFIKGVIQNKFIEVWEDGDGNVDVRYVLLDDAPKGVNELLVDSWVKKPT